MEKPQNMLKQVLNEPVLVTLNSGEVIFGVLRASDMAMNLDISDCDRLEYGADAKIQRSRLKKVRVLGRCIESIRFSDTAVKIFQQKIAAQAVTIPVLNKPTIVSVEGAPKPRFSLRN